METTKITPRQEREIRLAAATTRALRFSNETGTTLGNSKHFNRFTDMFEDLATIAYGDGVGNGRLEGEPDVQQASGEAWEAFRAAILAYCDSVDEAWATRHAGTAA